MTIPRIISAMILPCLLAGCGGGGSVASTAPPPVMPTYQALDTLSAAQPFAASAAVSTTITLTGGAPTAGMPAVGISALSISYDIPSRTYTLSFPDSEQTGFTTARSQTFGPAALVVGSSNRYVVSGRLNLESYTDTLTLNRGTPGGSVALSYVGWGEWQRSIGDRSTQNSYDRFFSYGIQTASGDLPRSGGATYSVGIAGTMSNGTVSAAMSGTGTLTADFAAGRMNAALSPVAAGLIAGGTSLTGSGAIDSTARSFTSSLAGGGLTGSLNGLFFGPQAIEVGGAFTFTGSTGSGAGIIAGKKN